MKLSLNTLACPAWSFGKIIDACRDNGISGIDFRGIASEIDITRLPLFNAEVYETLRVLGEYKLSMPCFNLSVTLITTDEKRWTEYLDEARRHAELAKLTRTRFLRVFGGIIPAELTRDQARDLGIRIPIIPGLLPILSAKQVMRITSMCGSCLPSELQRELELAGDDPVKSEDIGVKRCIAQATELLEKGAPGIHFYVLNKSSHMIRIMDKIPR